MIWDIELDKTCGMPLQSQIFQYYYQAITLGECVAGDMLPSIRMLAGKLQIARITVVLAYEKLISGGYIKSRPGIGYQVIFDRPIEMALQEIPYSIGPEPTGLIAAEVPGIYITSQRLSFIVG